MPRAAVEDDNLVSGGASREAGFVRPAGAFAQDLDGLADQRFALRFGGRIDDFLTKPLDREAILMRLRVAERILEYTTQIRQLKELIPICMYCKRIRDDSNYWDQLETYIHMHTGSNFSHGICPECFASQLDTLTRAGLKIAPPQ